MKSSSYRKVRKNESRSHLSPFLCISNNPYSLSPIQSLNSSRNLKSGFDSRKKLGFEVLGYHQKTFSLLTLPRKPLVIPGKKEEEVSVRKSVSPSVSFLVTNQSPKNTHLGKGIRLLKDLYAPIPHRLKSIEPQEKRFDSFSNPAETGRKREIKTPSTSEIFGRKSFLYSPKDIFIKGKGRIAGTGNPSKSTDSDLSDFEEAAGKVTRRNSRLPIVSEVSTPRPIPQSAQLTLEPVLNLYTINASELTNMDNSPDLTPNSVLKILGKKKQRLGNMRLIREVEEEGCASNRGVNSVEVLSLQAKPVSLMSDYTQATAAQLSNTKSLLSRTQRSSLRLNHHFF